ncbi:MAG: carbohydrate kinase [Eubacteriales bacterium]
MYDVVGLGEILIDFTPAGRTENGMKLFEQNPGGAPANMLAVISKAGLKAAFIGKVGKDMHGEFLKRTLEDIGIDTSQLLVDDSVFTTLAFVSLNENAERDFSFARKPGADTMIRYSEIDKKMLYNTKVFHIGSLSLTDEPARGTTIDAIKTAKKAGAIISYDPNYRQPLWKSKDTARMHMKSILPYVDIIKISDEETDLLTPYNDPHKAAEYLIERGIKLVAVTLGAEGSYIANEKNSVLVSGFRTSVVDTTGAGDSFWGGFVSRLILSDKKAEELTAAELNEFGKFGNAVASLAIEGRGGIPAIPDISRVRERLKSV